MKKKAWGIILAGCISLIITVIPSALPAADYPIRPIELIQPNAPGGGMDFIHTLFKPKVEKILKQPFIFTYKTGAAGMIGTMHVKGLKPDGYSLLAASPSTFILPPLTRKTADYTLDDFTPICNVSTIPLAFCVKEDSPYKTMKDFIEAAKTKTIKYATHGSFTSAHISMEAVGKMAGFRPIHIPYKGAAAAMTAALGGHVDAAFSGTTAFVGPGKLRVLAVASERRIEGLPDVPTFMELGYPINAHTYYSLWGPLGIPEDIVGKIYKAHVTAFEENRGELNKIAGGQEHNILILNPKELRNAYQKQHDFYKKFLAELKDLK
jgi:tripartite-type tricarboxylate transporter receptor subunit TctC